LEIYGRRYVGAGNPGAPCGEEGASPQLYREGVWPARAMRDRTPPRTNGSA